MFQIENRRYIGNKAKLMPWIKEIIELECINSNSFFDVFAGTGVVTKHMLGNYSKYIINDFLYSNEIIYKGFFENKSYDNKKLVSFKDRYFCIDEKYLDDNYVSFNYADKFFSYGDSKKIGYIRQDIEDKYNSGFINEKEYYILLASLIYSLDRIANTVGHYEAYIKTSIIEDVFVFDLIQVEEIKNDLIVEIYRENANAIAKKIKSDIAFIDPPYNSRQYSRFYHVLETIVKWDKPKLYGVAMKPIEENMSDYCRASAKIAFEDLIKNLNVKYIVVTYNNTYNPKSKSSKNKITLEDIESILNTRGKTKRYEKTHKFFNSGKTNFNEHKEYLFITKVEN